MAAAQVHGTKKSHRPGVGQWLVEKVNVPISE
jgi:hypothetical protein